MFSLYIANFCTSALPYILIGTYKKQRSKRFKKPSASTDIAGSLTSSIKYNSLNEGKAIKIKIKAGVIVQISSINVSSTLLLSWTMSLPFTGFPLLGGTVRGISRVVSEDPTHLLTISTIFGSLLIVHYSLFIE